jgi:DNA-directed RNA polymerase beta' subunit
MKSLINFSELKIQSDRLGNLTELSFDGDEMNLHMPQDPESEAELKNLAAVPYQMISPANNSSIIGIFQDSMLGSYQFTRPGIQFTPREAMNLLMMLENVNEKQLLEIVEKKGMITNFDILSQIMPPLSMKYKTKAFKEDKDDVSTSNAILEIRNGKYIRGQMDKSVLGAGTKGLIQRVCNDFGNMASAKFIDDLQNVVTEYMKSSAFSVGISDLISDQKTNDQIIEVITKKKQDVKNLIDQTQIGIFENNTGKTNLEEFETQVNSILNQATSESGKIGLQNLNKNNRFVTMVNAGSKGSDLNISFMISCLGQQNVDGKRIPYGFEHRTLPHFAKYDDSPSARGFVESSYINGLSPQELFFHAMGGRVGLIDTAVKTSSTGYIQRRLIKGLEDLMVSYDMTVRNNKNKIVQFSYGDDNIDTTKVENQIIPLVSMSTQDIYAHYVLPEGTGNTKTLGNIFLKNVMTRYKKQQTDMMKKAEEYIAFMIEQRESLIKKVFKNKGDMVVNCPVAFQYIIHNIQGQCNITLSTMTDITPLEAFQMIEHCYHNLEKNHYAPPTLLFKILYYFYLSPKDLLLVKRFNKNALTLLLDTITLDYKRAIVTPGEMVGIIAGQSIGEISTQMTLNSVTYETPIIVRNSAGEIRKYLIGDFIEQKITLAKKIEYMKEKDTTYAEVEEYFEIPSCDEEGNVLWKQIEAVTKHPVINTDGTNTMLKITTDEEREVIATKAKSFLKRVDGKIIPVNGDSLQVGDYLPVSTKPIDFMEKREWNWTACLDDTEKSFNQVPTSILLDYSFGYTLGAYASVGSISDFQVCIPSKKKEYFQPILEWCEKWNIVTKIEKQEKKKQKNKKSEKNSENRKETSCNSEEYSHVYMDSEFLSTILEKICGNSSNTSSNSSNSKWNQESSMRDIILFSNKECLLGFVDAYMGGCGKINIVAKTMTMSSSSKSWLMDVQQILNILHIYSYFKSKPVKNEIYQLVVKNNQLKKLASLLYTNRPSTNEDWNVIMKDCFQCHYEIDKKYTSLPNEIDGKRVFESRTQDQCKDILFDKIKRIEEVQNTTNYAYDLTVADTKNFNIYNGLAIRDTFHFAGVASKSNVTRGVPRIEEILSLSSDIKNPSLSVYLKPEDETQKEKAQTIMYMLEHTRLEEIVKSVEVCFDPDDLNTLISEDKDTMEQYRAFENMVSECAEVSLQNDENEKSKWIIRMIMDPEVMLEKNITMDDVNFTLNNCYENQISCVYSDFNADKLIFRIRMNEVIKAGTGRGGQKKVKVNPLDQSDQIYILKNFQDQLLQNIVLRGIKGINKVILRKILDNMVEKNGVYVKQDIWVLDTIGTNLLDVLGLDFIDNSRTMSNDIIEIYHVLGIEAARNAIYNELVDVVEFDGTYVNYHNYSVLLDRMTFTHKLISIFRHGINNDNIGPIAKASFEETPEMFLKAARYAELDTLRGVSANIMCGQEGFFGTSAFQVVLDIEEMQKMEEVSPYVQMNVEDEIEAFFGGIDNPEDPCGIHKIAIQNNVVTIQPEDIGKDNDYNPGF